MTGLRKMKGEAARLGFLLFFETYETKKWRPVTVRSGGVLLAVPTLSCDVITHLRVSVTITGSTHREIPVSSAAVIAAPTGDLGATRALTSDLIAQLGHRASRVTIARCKYKKQNRHLVVFVSHYVSVQRNP